LILSWGSVTGSASLPHLARIARRPETTGAVTSIAITAYSTRRRHTNIFSPHRISGLHSPFLRVQTLNCFTSRSN